MDRTARKELTRTNDDSIQSSHASDPGVLREGEPTRVTFDEAAATPPITRDQNAPLFWTRHDRSVSSVSYQSLVTSRPAAITLEDHSEEHDVQTQGCWAKSVTIEDYTIISGPTGIGAYVVWNCIVETLKGGSMSIRKRYSEFDSLRLNLVEAFPHAEASIPQLPRKSVVSRFRTKFLEQRKNGLNHFMNCILLNPEFAASPILKEFIFS